MGFLGGFWAGFFGPSLDCVRSYQAAFLFIQQPALLDPQQSEGCGVLTWIRPSSTGSSCCWRSFYNLMSSCLCQEGEELPHRLLQSSWRSPGLPQFFKSPSPGCVTAAVNKKVVHSLLLDLAKLVEDDEEYMLMVDSICFRDTLKDHPCISMRECS